MPSDLTCPLCPEGDPKWYRTMSYLTVTISADFSLTDGEWRAPTPTPQPYPRPPGIATPDTIAWMVGCPNGHVLATSAGEQYYSCLRHADTPLAGGLCDCDDIPSDERQWWRPEDREWVLTLIARLRGAAAEASDA